MTQGTLREIRETQENFLERKFSRTLPKNFKADHGSRGLDSRHFCIAETLTDF